MIDLTNIGEDGALEAYGAAMEVQGEAEAINASIRLNNHYSGRHNKVYGTNVFNEKHREWDTKNEYSGKQGAFIKNQRKGLRDKGFTDNKPMRTRYDYYDRKDSTEDLKNKTEKEDREIREARKRKKEEIARQNKLKTSVPKGLQMESFLSVENRLLKR